MFITFSDHFSLHERQEACVVPSGVEEFWQFACVSIRPGKENCERTIPYMLKLLKKNKIQLMP
jgi:hypothetical protein